MKILLRFAGIAAALVLLGGVMAYFAGVFHDTIDPARTDVREAAPAPETVYTVRSLEEPLTEQVTGTVAARAEAVVSARITATIAAINVRAGDTVQAGDVLVELDARDLQARLAQQEQAVAGAQARVAEARPNFERMQDLVQKNLVSRADYDRALAALRAAEAELGQAGKAADEARTALSYSTIRAPFAGRVVDRYVEPGDTALPGAPIIRLYDPGLMRLEANVPESIAAFVETGTRLGARIDAIDLELEVTVEEVVPSADPGSRSVLIKAVLPREPGLYPGLFGRLFVPRGTVRTVYVPPGAVRQVGQLEFVSVVTESGVVRRQIRTGALRHGGMIEVRSGLTDGESILREPH